ncbi:MAG: hypothetical protein PVI86_12035 [Phycisphaerae bacterium]|jgi:hypothetical protein
MKTYRRIDYVVLATVVGIGVCLFASSGRAAIIDIDAEVSTTVQELIDGAPASVSSDENQLPDEPENLTIRASSDLTSTDLSGALVSMGQSISDFFDPIRLDQPNPEEFALEVAAYSNSDSIAYSATSSAGESRTILFTTEGNPDIPPEIDFGPTNTETIESTFFLSGAVLIWSTDADAGFDETLAQLDVVVSRDGTAGALFETAVSITGDADGGTTVVTDRPIRVERITLDDLAAEGVDQDSLTVLEGIESVGTLVILAIPPQEHVYEYTVTADESLVLTARLDARIRSGPGGTGVAAAFGAPFANLATFIEEGLPGVSGQAVQRSINDATAARAIGRVADGSGDQTSAARLCGVLGVEWVAMSFVGLTLFARRLHKYAS